MTTTPYGWNVCFGRPTETEYAWQMEQALDLLQPDRWMAFHWEQFVDRPGFVPTIWNDRHVRETGGTTVADRLLSHPDETWFFLNEPHLTHQANMTEEEAVDLAFWFLNLAHDLDVPVNWVGPNCAVNMAAEHVGGVSGKTWWRNWLRLMRKSGIVRPSFHGAHMYNSSTAELFVNTWRALRDDWRWQFIGDGGVILTEVCAHECPVEAQIEVMDAAYEVYRIGLDEGPTSANGALGVYWFCGFDWSQINPWYPCRWKTCALTEVDPGRVRTMRLTPLGEHWKLLQARL